MSPTETAALLRQLNEWRRGGDIDPPGPLAVGEAIDAAVEMIERLEAAEKATTEAYRREYTTVQEAIEKEREACAITAWTVGMELYKKQFDAREVGASCASAIRARVKYDTFKPD